MTLVAYIALLVLVALQRLAELQLSRRNSRRARAAGAVERGSGHYPWMVALHSLFLPACAVEVWLLDRPLIVPLALTSLILLLGATVLRYAAIRALGERWTTRVFHWPSRPLIQTGPYRWIPHPNYLAVVLEIVALPMVHTAWISAVVFTLFNGWLLAVRLRVENEVLSIAVGYSSNGPLRTRMNPVTSRGEHQ